MNPVMSLFHEVSPYEGLDIDQHPADMQGWASYDPLFEEIISKCKPKVIVEVGTWKGASAIHMAKLAQKYETGSTVICIDTWLGSHEHFLTSPELRERRNSLRMKNGYPQLYFTFLANVIREGLQDVIVPLPMTSAHGAIILRRTGVRPDLIHIDGAHEYPAVISDLRDYWPLLTEEGILLGDDYTMNDVGRAAFDFSREVGKQIVGNHYKFILSKHKTLTPKVFLT